MNTKHGYLVTDKGLDIIRNATLSGRSVTIESYRLGDGNGSVYFPQGRETGLKREVYRGKITHSSNTNGNPSSKKVFIQVPESAGNFWVREIGLYDSDGNLIFIGAHPQTEKRSDNQSSSVLEINMQIDISRAECVTIQLDSQIGITRTVAQSIASEAVKEHEEKSNPHSQYALKANTYNKTEVNRFKRELNTKTDDKLSKTSGGTVSASVNFTEKLKVDNREVFHPGNIPQISQVKELPESLRRINSAIESLDFYSQRVVDNKLYQQKEALERTINTKASQRDLSDHKSASNPHSQYALKSDTENKLNQKASKGDLSNHLRHSNPHSQYALKDDVFTRRQVSSKLDLFYPKTEVDSKILSHKRECQFLPYDRYRTYRTGEICTTWQGGKLCIWQWYAKNSAYGKNPDDQRNRHEGWARTDSPFYWIPYTGNQTGMPFFWLDTSAPEWAVMEINVNLPVAVYWRLAECYPHLVTGNYINTGEIRGEFLRVLDQGRGVDSNREIASYQAGTKIAGEAGDGNSMNTHTIHDISRVYGDPVYETTFDMRIQYNAYTHHQRLSPAHAGWWRTTRPRNVSRPMAIAI